MKTEYKYLHHPMCGLWHANVVPSEHNDDGGCECINCGGTHCHGCAQYARLQDANSTLGIFEKTKCQLCQACREKTK